MFRPLMQDTRIPNGFWVYLGSRFCSATAMTLLRAAVAWHVFELSHSAFHLGLVGLVQFVPVLALTLVGGAVADAYDRRRIMRAAQIPILAGGALLAVATAQGAASLPILYAARVLHRSGVLVRLARAPGAAAEPGADRRVPARGDLLLDGTGAGLRDRARRSAGSRSPEVASSWPMRSTPGS